MIAPNHIESGTGRIIYTETADEQGAISGKYVVKPGNIIYSKIRPALNKVCIATGDWLCSADMYPVAISEKRLAGRYLLYFMLSEPLVRLMVDESMRVAMPKVNREKLAACPLLIPTPADGADRCPHREGPGGHRASQGTPHRPHLRSGDWQDRHAGGGCGSYCRQPLRCLDLRPKR